MASVYLPPAENAVFDMLQCEAMSDCESPDNRKNKDITLKSPANRCPNVDRIIKKLDFQFVKKTRKYKDQINVLCLTNYLM